LVREYCREAETLITHSPDEPSRYSPLSGQFLDGNCLSHRSSLKVLRRTRAGALPGKSLVVFDPALGIALDVLSL